MKIQFYKYQGTGNDFVIIDDRNGLFPQENEQKIVHHICNRKFGIGADGLILLQDAEGFDFRMKYYNADGNESSMCGNGGRCIVAFANFLGVISNTCKFIAIDGPHEASILENGNVRLKMSNVWNIENYQNDFITDTGSPHYVSFVEKVKDFNVYQEGFDIRNSEKFKKEGINVNFVEEKNEGELFVRTFERGVEDETLSCGTGITAAALCYHHKTGFNDEVKIKSLGGELSVSFIFDMWENYNDIYLTGPAQQVFQGKIII